MLIDHIPLFSQIFITLGFNDDNEMDGSFSHIFFIFYQELDLYYGNKTLYLGIFLLPWQQKFKINFVKK